jgi:hypothetical protein
LPSHPPTKPPTLSELFLSEEQSIRSLGDVIRELDGSKDFPDIRFNDRRFEVVIDLDQERGS